MKRLKQFCFAIIAAGVLYACKPAGGNHPGSEYMPDMAHSVAYEGNVYTYYYYNTWDSASTFKLYDLAQPGLPAEGVIPRGYAGIAEAAGPAERKAELESLRGENKVNAIAVPVNGHVPFHYEDSEEERTRATEEIVDNPFPITAEGLAKGEELYNVFCAICHGEKANGLGYLVAEENPNVAYPVQPANLLLDDYLYSSNGRYYYSIMYGKNVMGAYKDKLSYEERWQVIHWIRHLQAEEKGLQYDENGNTLQPEFGMPGAEVETLADAIPGPSLPAGEAAAVEQDVSHSDGEDHGDDH